ncbi:tetratricopeptide repeat protein [Capsaspora owczarzaki ATCC 30864]|uniref:ER membrane protein complex subunit 2 n=1 Tax=Capsaspora owczarzaki (strain ATCC 30864) TaxID=595528 RepID=A0A0D2X4G1_CAPO3|nr:tetratricopeptide repeat protein [Capsaspora owczarzaki ATCC 30864]KJE95999.1 tetratricopeptide repeat protein [Capsaspora owczarzaki ATCC 30864]|eukprot:XP_004345124.2 tetratricopeptide repeat protein [Capsaspora owczarzaki ATCC 30864]
MVKQQSVSQMKARLSELRKTNQRQSELVLELAEAIQSGQGARSLAAAFSDEAERWDVLEQVARAAMDCGRARPTRGEEESLAATLVKQLAARFPESNRVKLLQGELFEAQGDWAGATQLYDELLTETPNHAAATKRKAVIFKSRGDIPKAISVLAAYVQQAMADYEAWVELSELYLSRGDFQRAAFCFEELILSNPLSPVYHIRYAETLYTMGSLENLQLARKHYANACKIQPDDARSLLGLYMTCSALNSEKFIKQRTPINEELEAFAVSRLKQLYSKQASAPQLECLNETFSKMALTTSS